MTTTSLATKPAAAKRLPSGIFVRSESAIADSDLVR